MTIVALDAQPLDNLWARDDSAGRHPSIAAAQKRLITLAHDCAQMRAMFVATPPEFEVVIARLGEAERTLNASGAY